jgi:hypothetical protein
MSEDNNENEPLLNREEVGKLLLLTSKALELKIISDEQKGFIKDQICMRAGILRVILKYEDLSVVMGALAMIPGAKVEK